MKLNDKRINAYRKVLKSPEDTSSEENRPETRRDGALSAPRASKPEGKEPDRQPSVPADVPQYGIPGLLKTEAKPGGKETVYRRVAKFLLLIGVNEAAKVLAHLTPEQTEKIIPEIASIRRIDSDESAVILADFENLLLQAREAGGVDTARTILEKAFGSERAREMLLKAVPFAEGKPFEYLEEMKGDRLYFFLKDESSAVQALVLARLKPALAASVINLMPSGEKKEIIQRLAKIIPIDPDVIRRIDRAMREKVNTGNAVSAESVDGRGALAEILRRMDFGSEQEILAGLSETDPDLGQDLRSRLFTIDDIVRADDRFIQTKLRDLSDERLAFLIAGKPETFRSKILSNMSKTRASLVLDEENIRKPVSRKDSDTITSAFFSDLRRAWEDGRLTVAGRGDDDTCI